MRKKIDILFQSDSLLAIEKPTGILSVPDRYNQQRPSIAIDLLEEYPTARPLHRLDTDTSGVILFCLLPEAFGWYSDQFENKSVHKKYLALSDGRCMMESGMIDKPLFTQDDGKVIITRKGKASQTEWLVKERFRFHTLFELHPLSGRTHQIRVHLASIGHPIVGDPVYGGSKGFYLSSIKGKNKYKLSADLEVERPIISRVALHASSISIRDFENQQPLVISSDLPKDMRVAVTKLRQWSALDQ
jgi:23S rRNA pseudouridine955/2504/2580 synthase/23S rRNA pseudouridine1911/1915/1917 synthase